MEDEDSEMTASLMDELMEAMTQHEAKELKPHTTVVEVHIHPHSESGIKDGMEKDEEEGMKGLSPKPVSIEDMLKKGR